MVRVPGPVLVSPNPPLPSVTAPSPRVTPAVVTLTVWAPVRVVPVKVMVLPAVPGTVSVDPPADRVPIATDVYPDTSRLASALRVTLFPGVRAAGAAVVVPFRAKMLTTLPAVATAGFWNVIELSVLAWSAAGRVKVTWYSRGSGVVVRASK